MPFEPGINYAALRFGQQYFGQKMFLVLEKDKYEECPLAGQSPSKCTKKKAADYILSNSWIFDN